MTYTLTTTQITLLTVLIVWEIIWKGVALWRAAQRKQPYWFAALLVINSAGIFPIIYLLMTSMHDEASDEGYIKASHHPAKGV